jgi:predicted NAD-dependent protein-ADP-ribosyltransferase YbiA (DUF1768 family)
MVKDGLQTGYASLLEAISPFTMDSYLSQIETANKALRTDDDVNIKKVFGLNRTQLEFDFVNNYLQSNINGPLLYTMSRSETGSLPKGVTIKDNKITIKWEDMYGTSPKDFVRLKLEDIATGFVTYKTYMATTQDESTTKVYEEIETKGSNQQNPIGFMFGERPMYKAVRQLIKTKNLGAGQDSFIDDIQFDEMSFAQGVQTAALQDEDAAIEATEFGVNINGNNIANISALETMLNAEPKQQNTINIYAGTGENAELSNFANRPFKYSGEYLPQVTFNSVEVAFQKAKLSYSLPITQQPLEVQSAINNVNLSSAEAKQLGKKIKGLNVQEWDTNSLRIMKDLIKQSFEQNPAALQKLLDTGNAELTHTQDKTRWGKEFPRLLMEVRSELSNSQAETTATLVDSMSDLERELYEEFTAEVESDYSAIENFWDANIQKDTQAKENLRLNNNVLSLEDLIDMYNKGIYTSQEEFIEQIKQCNL